MTPEECYKTLQLKAGAGMEDIKKSFRRLAFQLHPDLNPSDPKASRKFQRLNEAYVYLKHLHETGHPPRTNGPGGASGRAGSGQRPGQAKAGPRPSARPQGKAPGPSPGRPGDQGQRQAQAHGQDQPGQQAQSAQSARQAKARAAYEERRDGFYFRQEEVLQDILKDPFARKVYEDIFKTAGKSFGQTGTARPPGAAAGPAQAVREAGDSLRKRQISLEWGDRQITFDLSKGLWTGMKGWVRGQMDDEQTVCLPPSMLQPGKVIRIQIRRGLGNTPPVSVEVKLPPDFVIGRPVRLKGLGRQIGPLKGDLYLRLLVK